MKRDKSIAKDQKKLEELRRKLHTEDDSKFVLMFSACVAAVKSPQTTSLFSYIVLVLRYHHGLYVVNI